MPLSTDTSPRRLPLPYVFPDRIFSLTGRILHDGGCVAIANSVRAQDEAAAEPILITIDCPGGVGREADLLATIIRFCRSPTIGLVITRAYSAGFNILQACDLRMALQSSSLLAHHGSVPASTQALNSASHAEAFVKWKTNALEYQQAAWDKKTEVLSSRTGLDPERVSRLLRQDRVLKPIEAFELGFLDAVI